MKFPSLLYKENTVRALIEPQVFDDVRLSALVAGDVLRCSLPVCTAEDISCRREMFVCAEDEAFRAALKRLADGCADIAFYAEAGERARTAEEKNVIFLSLSRAMLGFYRLAASLTAPAKCDFTVRLSEYFQAELSKDYIKRMTAKLDELLSAASAITHNSNLFRIRGERLRIAQGNAESFTDIISRCAENLSLTPPDSGAPLSAPLSENIIGGIASLHPADFDAFAQFAADFGAFYSPDILRYCGELNFYLGFCEVRDRARRAGIPVCYPEITDERVIALRDAYDLSLLTKDEMKIIPNDISFDADAPFCYLTGANGGGKTTYLRTVGVAVLTAMLGCPVACEGGRLYIPHGVYTHFPRDERFDKTGRFADEQNRVDAILAAADDRSLVLLNETYSTTGEESAVRLTSALAERLWSMGAYGIYITHQHSISESHIPYLNVVVDRSDANRRTYKVERRRDDAGSFAHDVLEKYSLTPAALEKRFAASANGGNDR